MFKSKIINDPLYGFVSIKSELAFSIIEHPVFQRLRQISQLGLAHFVYPGAKHSRFQHALGAYHLMGRSLDCLKNKGVEISNEESEACQLAILLHDIGHGPFSHSLEETLLSDLKHESLTYLLIQQLNKEFNNQLALTIKIFQNTYKRKFFHQLVNSQLDVDRLDYLNRDSFFTGVHEGNIGIDRIIDMMNVANDNIVIEEKGILSIENFLTSRRLMYWQVYLHKTSVSAERLLVNIIKRARYISTAGETLLCSNSLKVFLENDISLEDLKRDHSLLTAFSQLDDTDVWGAIKLWQDSSDKVLASLCSMIIERKLFRIQLSTEPINKEQVEKVRHKIMKKYNLLKKDSAYLFSHGTVSNEAYTAEGKPIMILLKNGELIELASASDLPQVRAMTKTVKKNFLCWPKNVDL
jgi:HD superfamily phosphohydrolase